MFGKHKHKHSHKNDTKNPVEDVYFRPPVQYPSPPPKDYHLPLSKLDIQKACDLIDKSFERRMCDAFNLTTVQVPLAIRPGFGINDDLDGDRQPVRFHAKNGKDAHGIDCEILQASTKWKRLALKQFECKENEGVMCNLKAIRKDTKRMDSIHSIYVDQWDYEVVMNKKDKTLEKLKEIVNKIWSCIKETEKELQVRFPDLRSEKVNGKARFVPPLLPEKVTFIHSAELLDMYPDLEEPNDRENAFLKENKDTALFIYGIGMKLKNGQRHQERAPDYDLYISGGEEKEGRPGLNGDLLVYNHITQDRHELTSMGIRVGPEELVAQLKDMNFESRMQCYFHQLVYKGELPECFGGGIGKSRLFALMLHCWGIGEVVSSPWPDKMIEECKKMGIELLE